MPFVLPSLFLSVHAGRHADLSVFDQHTEHIRMRRRNSARTVAVF